MQFSDIKNLNNKQAALELYIRHEAKCSTIGDKMALRAAIVATYKD